LRSLTAYEIPDVALFKKQLLLWAQQFEEVVWLDSNAYKQDYSSYDAVLAADAFTLIKTDSMKAFDKLQEYQAQTADWIFGYLSYDLKNDVEQLRSKNYDGLGFPELYFFQPKRLFLLKGNTVTIQYLRVVDDEIVSDFEGICALAISSVPKYTAATKSDSVNIKLRMTKDVYQQKVRQLLAHIYRGDIYEANFCQEFYAEDCQIDPLESYMRLNAISKPPFATFLKLEELFLLSATPERYLRKEGTRIISQPIKGTAKRALFGPMDVQFAKALANDAKERAENIMIVDLVRNDLSRTATKGSVQVAELCKVYAFEQVHQMVSTIVAEINPRMPIVDVLRTTFPMGSMTGAPKIAAMQLIEALEETKRGLYSGAVGYFTPEGDFDFNVIIRSILYNASKKYVSYSVGSAITAKAIPEKEYEECLLKAKAMRQVLEQV